MTVNELIGKLNALPEEQKEMSVRFCKMVKHNTDSGDTQVDCNFLDFTDCEVVEFIGKVVICSEKD